MTLDAPNETPFFGRPLCLLIYAEFELELYLIIKAACEVGAFNTLFSGTTIFGIEFIFGSGFLSTRFLGEGFDMFETLLT